MAGSSIEHIAKELGAKAEGAVGLVVSRLSEPATAAADHLALAMSEKYLPDLAKGQAKAAILAEGTDWRALGLEAAILIARRAMRWRVLRPSWIKGRILWQEFTPAR